MMAPSSMSTVPFSMGGPDTGYTLPPVMAIVCADAAEADGGGHATAMKRDGADEMDASSRTSARRHEAELEVGAPRCAGSTRSKSIAPSIHTFSARA